MRYDTYTQYEKAVSGLYHDGRLREALALIESASDLVPKKDGFGWLGNPYRSREDIRTCYHKVRQDYSVDESRVFIGGFSGGAICTIDIVMGQYHSCKGSYRPLPRAKAGRIHPGKRAGFG